MGMLLPFIMLSFFLDMLMTPAALVVEAGKAIAELFNSAPVDTVQMSSVAENISHLLPF